MSVEKINLGLQGEDAAVDFLTRRGYTIILRNFRNRLGEIDIVAKQENTICFIEVKTRTTDTQGNPLEAITYFKKRKLSRLALAYLKQYYGTLEVNARFDVVAITADDDGHNRIQLIEDAFEFCE